ncbi:septum formation initiator family protein [Vicingus serpentipes]|jgi:cell division protein DivIC|uniref:Septum formation initiator family protein n=1 Tax=Vicingus serpentipes TaxID=1926625 RepID=A0A5C6RX37_9FLAO|nr:septum formation initiator family protein [Vicingus serpentipes]TXB66657.1 septum formation initiator family protein [Vicingus serpentipes]
MWSKIPNWLKNKYAITIVIFIVWLSFFDQNNFLVQYDFKKELRSLNQDKRFYLEEIKKTKIELEELTTNPVTLEKFAREKYLMKKDNEEIFVFELEKE